MQNILVCLVIDFSHTLTNVHRTHTLTINTQDYRAMYALEKMLKRHVRFLVEKCIFVVVDTAQSKTCNVSGDWFATVLLVRTGAVFNHKHCNERERQSQENEECEERYYGAENIQRETCGERMRERNRIIIIKAKRSALPRWIFFRFILFFFFAVQCTMNNWHTLTLMQRWQQQNHWKIIHVFRFVTFLFHVK